MKELLAAQSGTTLQQNKVVLDYNAEHKINIHEIIPMQVND